MCRILDYVEAVRAAILAENWYAALPLALALPDVCGWLEDPAAGTRERYERWCERFLLAKYSNAILGELAGDSGPFVFLPAADCYALRCAFLHEGRNDISTQRAREVLQRVYFTRPGGGVEGHCGRLNDLLQLDTVRFCEDVCEGVVEWKAEVADRDAAITSRMTELLTIRLFSETPGFGSMVGGRRPKA
jgi:hypothetical protein